MEQLLGLDHGPRRPGMRDLTRMMNRVDAAQLAQMTVEDVQTQKPQREFEISIRWPDGQERFLQSTTRYFYGADATLERLVGIYMDVTDKVRDRTEVAKRGKRLLDLQSELAHTSRLSAMGEMAASLAHELNQPLTAIGTTVGAIALMASRTGSKDPDGDMQRILRAARHAESQAVRAGEIVRRLREFIARGEADMQREDVAGLVEDALALALPNPGSAGVTVQKRVDRRAATVLADRVQIQQVMVNLIRNAVEAMRPQTTPRRLIIAIVPGGAGMAVISVADTGPGVKGPDQAELFAAFVSSKSDGMGVGLSICRRIVEGHGGQMWFEPTADGGAEFRFTLPMISSATKTDESRGER
jgi:two-component system sensor kinase FixL